MTQRHGRGLLDWLRTGPTSGETPDTPPAPDDESESMVDLDPLRLARRQLLTDITDFLMAHDLEINPTTLGIAHDYLAGADSQLMRQIDERLHQREPITLAWLEAYQREAQPDQRETLSRLMNRLETNIEQFGRSTKAAKSAASDYSSALGAHVEDLGATRTPVGQERVGSEVVGELMSLAQAMIERTRNLENDMARSVVETRALKRSLEQARRNADQDHLTGLPNRRAFEARFSAEYAGARAAGEQLCVAFCDIDHFKRINDEHGHEAGDRVLKAVAECLAHISDDRCHVARHGGEEFVVLLRGRSLHAAWELLDDARQQLADREMVNRATDRPFGRITFSSGIADVFASADPRAALRAADRALYRAKAEGRNRVALADGDLGATDRHPRR